MEADDLTVPLGQSRKPRRRQEFQISGLQVFIAGLALLALILLARMVVLNEPIGGEAVAPLRSASVPASRSEPTALFRAERAAELPRTMEDSQATEPAAPDAPRNRTITVIDGSSGKRHEIMIPDSAGIDELQAVTARRGAATVGPPGISSGSLSPAR